MSLIPTSKNINLSYYIDIFTFQATTGFDLFSSALQQSQTAVYSHVLQIVFEKGSTPLTMSF